MYRSPLDLNYGDWERYGSPILCRLCGATVHRPEPQARQVLDRRRAWLCRLLPGPGGRPPEPGQTPEPDHSPLVS
jgi:hypothetical protein